MMLTSTYQTLPCGCALTSVLNGTVCMSHQVVYCPVHRAAPEMLEALKPLAALATYYSDTEGNGPCLVSTTHGTIKLTGADVHRAARLVAGAEGKKALFCAAGGGL